MIHGSVFSETNRQLLVDVLRRFDLPHTLVSFDELGEPVPYLDPQGAVYVCGAWKMQRLAIQRGWNPGSFLSHNFSVEVWAQHLPGELLNGTTLFSTVEDLNLEAPMFVRPIEDTKSFDGAVFSAEEFEELRMGDASIGQVRVSASRVRTIMREYRLFFVGGRFVTGSLYRQGGEIVLSRDVDPEAIVYAEGVVQRWAPADSFVVDVALSDDRYWVVEFNNINSSGFYAADVERYVHAIERLYGS